MMELNTLQTMLQVSNPVTCVLHGYHPYCPVPYSVSLCWSACSCIVNDPTKFSSSSLFPVLLCIVVHSARCKYNLDVPWSVRLSHASVLVLGERSSCTRSFCSSARWQARNQNEGKTIKKAFRNYYQFLWTLLNWSRIVWIRVDLHFGSGCFTLRGAIVRQS